MLMTSIRFSVVHGGDAMWNVRPVLDWEFPQPWMQRDDRAPGSGTDKRATVISERWQLI